MKTAWITLGCWLLVAAAGTVRAGSVDGEAVLGGALGGAAGAAVGSALGGREGAIVGGALGGAAGVAIAADKPKPRYREREVVRVYEYEDRHDNGLHLGHRKHKYHDD
jgi:outer membrane lipoprotein SlyB